MVISAEARWPSLPWTVGRSQRPDTEMQRSEGISVHGWLTQSEQAVYWCHYVTWKLLEDL